MKLPVIQIERDPWFRSSPGFIPRVIRDIYFHVLKDGLRIDQARFYFDSNGLPFLSTVAPSDNQWGQEYTVQELIDLIHERLQEEDDAQVDE